MEPNTFICDQRSQMNVFGSILSYSFSCHVSNLNIISWVVSSVYLCRNETSADINRAKRRQERLTRYSSSTELYNLESQYVFADYAPKIFDRIRKLSGIAKEDYLVQKDNLWKIICKPQTPHLWNFCSCKKNFKRMSYLSEIYLML